MKKHKLTILASIFAVFTSQAMASDSKTNLTASANIENFCNIQATDINFGVLASPLTSQTANGQVDVLCSNNTPYVIELAYGENAGTTGTGGYTYSFVVNQPTWTQASIYDSNKNLIGDIACDTSGRIGFSTQALASLYGYENFPIMSIIYDTKQACSGRTFNMTTFNNLSPKNPSNGIMKGLVKGDSLAYLITVPNDSTKTWATGFNNYSAVGNGQRQTITTNAKIVVDKSTSTYLAQDSYLDTVILTIKY